MTPPAGSLRVVLSLAIGVLTCPFLGCSGAKPEDEKTPPAPVKWETARLLVLEEWTELVGVTQPLPQRFALITAPVEGRIVSLLGGTDNPKILEGQPISKGQEVAHLDDRVLKSNLAKLNASVTEAEAQISTAESVVHAAQLKVDRLEELDRGGSRAGGGSDAEVSRMVRKTDLPDARVPSPGQKLSTTSPWPGSNRRRKISKRSKFSSRCTRSTHPSSATWDGFALRLAKRYTRAIRSRTSSTSTVKSTCLHTSRPPQAPTSARAERSPGGAGNARRGGSGCRGPRRKGGVHRRTGGAGNGECGSQDSFPQQGSPAPRQ